MTTEVCTDAVTKTSSYAEYFKSYIKSNKSLLNCRLQRPMAIASALHLYYLSKIVELLDSVFFILRGKYNQLTFLHVYHHSTMIALAWFNVNFLPGGNSVFGTLGSNSTVLNK